MLLIQLQKRGQTENLRNLFSKSFKIMSENHAKSLPSDLAFENGQMETFQNPKIVFGAQKETNFVKQLRGKKLSADACTDS